MVISCDFHSKRCIYIYSKVLDWLSLYHLIPHLKWLYGIKFWCFFNLGWSYPVSMVPMDATGCTRTGARKALGKRSPEDQVLDEKLIWRQQQSTVMATNEAFALKSGTELQVGSLSLVQLSYIFAAAAKRSFWRRQQESSQSQLVCRPMSEENWQCREETSIRDWKRDPTLDTYSYGHLPVITGYKWDYTFYKWGYKYL